MHLIFVYDIAMYISEIAVSKSSVPADSFPETPTAHHFPTSMHSTPSTTLSPSVTPFTTPTASPHSVTIAAFLAQATSSLQQSPKVGSPAGGAHASPIHSAPTMIPNSATKMGSPSSANPLSGLPSSQNAASLTVHGKRAQSSLSPVSAAKAVVLHHRCPSNQPECASPLTKSSFANTESIGNIQSSPVQGSSSSSMTSKSPSAKFVTVSLLQQLNISKLLSAASAHQSNGNGASAQL